MSGNIPESVLHSSNQVGGCLHEASSASSCYHIEYKERSESAHIFFAREQATGRKVVIKILRPYQDTRYSLLQDEERLRCQIEALHWNRIFTAGVYLGLGPVLKWQSEWICIGEIGDSLAVLEEGSGRVRDYALVMEYLPEEQRLDRLLETLCSQEHREVIHLLHCLVMRIVAVHDVLEGIGPEECDEHGLLWGSEEQLALKLEHNLVLFDLLADVDGERYREAAWLKDALRKVLAELQQRHYYVLRQSSQQIKRCHGDLKASNIWMLPDEQGGYTVNILDAIDFNPAYYNIDVLSDFAMLVVDIEGYTGDRSLADSMIDSYLQLRGGKEQSEQQEMLTRVVLFYYLVEKAIVRAAVGSVYDQLPTLGASFLRIAQERMRTLQALLQMSLS